MNKSVLITFLCICLALTALEAEEKPFISQHCREGCGFFSICSDVLALVRYYDKGYYDGIEVDFQESGLYYDSNHGCNWWEYYFQPISFGPENCSDIIEVWGTLPYSRPFEIEFHTTRHEAYELIQKYIKILPHIRDKIDLFRENNFSEHFVLGVHYRGTDKYTEAPRLSYQKVVQVIKKTLKSLDHEDDYKIFVATDEEPFIKYLCSQFPGKVCFVEDIIRSSSRDPVHYDLSLDRYKCGEDALVDCILLSHSDYLIRMSSNLSLWSTFFNPNLTVKQLNYRPYERH